MNEDILDLASQIANDVDRQSVLDSISDSLTQSPNGAWLFILTNARLEGADAVYIQSNVGPMEGLALADVYKHVTLTQAWGNNEEEDIDESEDSDLE